MRNTKNKSKREEKTRVSERMQASAMETADSAFCEESEPIRRAMRQAEGNDLIRPRCARPPSPEGNDLIRPRCARPPSPEGKASVAHSAREENNPFAQPQGNAPSFHHTASIPQAALPAAFCCTWIRKAFPFPLPTVLEYELRCGILFEQPVKTGRKPAHTRQHEPNASQGAMYGGQQENPVI